ncbi:MAG: hypothetical protein QNK75_10780 [Crocinitomicaceae bacterium]
MSWLAGIILSLEGLFFLVSIILIIYFGIRAFNKKQDQTFEDRDN